MVRFDVSSLIKAQPGTLLTLDLDVGPECLIDLEVAFLRGTVRVTRIQAGLLAQGAIKSQLAQECVRCLEPFEFPITLELEETFRLPNTGPKENTPYAVSEGGWLDLTPLLREQAWLAIPMKPLCAPKCKGLCPECGTNLNLESCTCEKTRVDPRLAVLKDLLR
jgi:uncharacterized protein